MAIVPKHIDQYPHYDPSDDFTIEQLHRFTKVANAALIKRKDRKRTGVSHLVNIQKKALWLTTKPESEEQHSQRYALLIALLGAAALSIMYFYG